MPMFFLFFSEFYTKKIIENIDIIKVIFWDFRKLSVFT